METLLQAVLPPFAKKYRHISAIGITYFGAQLLANFFWFLYSTYLGRTIRLEDFALISLFGSFSYLSQIVVAAVQKTVTHRSAYLFGKNNEPARVFWEYVRNRIFLWSIVASIIWLLLTPFLSTVFGSSDIIPFILFTPVWVIGMVFAVDAGFLSGNLKFRTTALITVAEALSKFVMAVVVVSIGMSRWVYAVLPFSMAVAALLAWGQARKLALKANITENNLQRHFPKRFFSSSVLLKVSGIVFLSVDVIMVKKFLPGDVAGQYGLIALVGKMIFSFGSLFAGFVNPLVSRADGKGQSANKIFYLILFVTTATCFMGFVGLGVLGNISVPLLLGPRANAILYLLPMYTFGMMCFTIANTVTNYHQVYHRFSYVLVGLAMAVVQVIGLVLFHDSLETVVRVISYVTVLYVVLVAFMHWGIPFVTTVFRNLRDALGVFGKVSPENEKSVISNRLHILIFNWRDTKHVWAGGAEAYIHELAKVWVHDGHHVTVFCGDDRRNGRNEVVDGVQIVRRGGFYTVYIWAFLYYILRFRKRYDVVIDCENGIPFFTSLYVRVPTFLLIHHVHQEVFRKHLRFPLSALAIFLESQVMPRLYRTTPIVTISESSREEIIRRNFADSSRVHIVYPGINLSQYARSTKTTYPSLLYLGRLKNYKRVDHAIRAFASISAKFKDAKLTVAGEGDAMRNLKELVLHLNLSDRVSFLGKVTDEEKIALLGSHWLMIQPSSIEGWGITVIEANACGTPVIASAVQGLRDSVRDGRTGVLFQPGNVRDLSLKIDMLLSDTDTRVKLEHHALLWAQGFDKEECAAKLLSLIVSYTDGNIPMQPFKLGAQARSGI